MDKSKTRHERSAVCIKLRGQKIAYLDRKSGTRKKATNTEGSLTHRYSRFIDWVD